MANLVVQGTSNPTRKLSAAVIATALVDVIWVLVSNLWPAYADPALKVSLTPIVVFLAGYMIHDEAVPVTTDSLEYANEAPSA